jgi:glycosyltransferase involved in cell wall biosynthesis
VRRVPPAHGYDFLSFQNALDVDWWMPFRRRQWKAGSPFVVRYVGSIVPDGQRRSLQDICQAVEELASCGEQIEMWVHTSPGDSRYLREAGFPSRSVHLERPPRQEHIARLLAEADLLVLPYNFDQRSARYIKLSLPTKAPAYMISASPILVYAPSDVATAKYAMREGWGHVVSTQSISVLRDEFRRLMKDDMARQRLGERAYSLACERHNAATVRPAFWKALTDAAQASVPPGIA